MAVTCNSHAREIENLNKFINCVSGSAAILVPKVLKVSVLLILIKILITNMQVNKQNNNYDCGLHMLHNLALLHKVSLTMV